MWKVEVDGKNILFHSICIFLSIAIALGAAELVLRSMTMSSGTGAGKLGQRWVAENWKPINSLNYRDYEPSGKHDKDGILFVGDSFTAGYGVGFTESYYYLAKQRLREKYESFNVGRPGAATRGELKNYLEYKQKYNIIPRLVVLQYMGDIDEYVRPPEWKPNIVLRKLGEYSEIVNLINTVVTYKKLGARYFNNVFAAYRDEKTWDLHRHDLALFFETVHKDEAAMILLIFPFLTNDYIDESATYVSKLKEFFQSACGKGDVLIDVTPLALSIPESERIVNAMDAHPSRRLHAALGELIARTIADSKDRIEAADVHQVHRCQPD